MVTLSNDVFERLMEVVRKARRIYEHSLLLRQQGHGSIVRTDLAMGELKASLDRLGEVQFEKVEDTAKRRNRRASK